MANYNKNDIKSYIGPDAFLEIGFAYFLNKKIFILNQIPNQQNKEEINSMNPICINNQFFKLSNY